MKVFTRHDYTKEHLNMYVHSYKSGLRNNKIRIISRLLGDVHGKSVLDIGIGSGFFSRFCMSNKAKKIISVDFADPIIEYHRQNNPDFRLVQADAQNLPFKNESFDTVLALDIIEHLYSPLEFLNEINKVLKKGGQLILTTPNTANVFEKTLKTLLKPPLIALRKIFPKYLQEKPHATTHVKEFSVRELSSLLKKGGFRICTFDTYNEHILYKILDPLLFGFSFLKGYKWRKAYFLLEKLGAEEQIKG